MSSTVKSKSIKVGVLPSPGFKFIGFQHLFQHFTQAYLRSRAAEHVRDREAAAGRIRTSRAIDIFIHRQRDIKISISAFIDLHRITTNMKSSGTRTSERLARKRQRLDEEEKKASAAGGHSVRSGSTGTFRPKIGGRPIAMDCGILPSE